MRCGNWMQIPSYPSNREADEGAYATAIPWREGAPVGRSQAGRPACPYDLRLGVRVVGYGAACFFREGARLVCVAPRLGRNAFLLERRNRR